MEQNKKNTEDNTIDHSVNKIIEDPKENESSKFTPQNIANTLIKSMSSISAYVTNYAFKPPHKLVIIVRDDLKMGKGKIAAQCCHGAVAAYKNMSQNNPHQLQTWELQGEPKVVLKIENDILLNELYNQALDIKLPAHIIRDAGRTQIPSGSQTVLAIGPAIASDIDKVTGKLKLL